MAITNLPLKIAVVGAGISGIGSAWLLSQKHDVHLFESENRLGGHAHTVFVSEPEKEIPIDTGFLVYNELTYPHLKNFFKILNVETVDSEMSLSVKVESKNLEWSGTNLNTVFAQRKNLFKVSFYQMLFEILRFGREAEENLTLAKRYSWSLKELLDKKKYRRSFYLDYLLPIGAAIWSTPESKMLDFPAETFLNFFINHKLLQVNNRPVWRTVKNGSIQYVQKAREQIRHVHIDTPVLSVERQSKKIVVRTATDSIEFDAVVMATHAPITAQILKNKSEAEEKILSSIRYENNKTILHRDSNFMPKNKICWSSWNVLGSNDTENIQKVSLSYYLNRLQPLPTDKNYFVTLNPLSTIQNAIREFQYSHPQFDHAAIQAQNGLSAIQGNGGIYYAGAWTRYGFHEDGLLSAVKVAELLNTPIPWSSV